MMRRRWSFEARLLEEVNTNCAMMDNIETIGVGVKAHTLPEVMESLSLSLSLSLDLLKLPVEDL